MQLDGLCFWILMTILVCFGIVTVIAIAYYLYEQYQIQWCGMEVRDVKFKDFAHDSGIFALGCLILLVLMLYLVGLVISVLFKRYVLKQAEIKPTPLNLIGSPE